MASRPKHDRFHGRLHESEHTCDHPGCMEAGEFRAPKTRHRRGGFDGPGEYRYFCLDHVREFNTRYNFFSGMDEDEIWRAQRPGAGWERETRSFASNGADPTPRWQDFADPLDAIGARFRKVVRAARKDGKPLSGRDRENLQILGLEADADRSALRKRYAELLREYHPDRNGGDRSHEQRLLRVIDAYTELKRAPAFA